MRTTLVQEAACAPFARLAPAPARMKSWLLCHRPNCPLDGGPQQQRRAFLPLNRRKRFQDGYAITATHTRDPEMSSIRRDDSAPRTCDLCGIAE